MAQADFLTQQNLDSFKALYPADARLQSLSLSELRRETLTSPSRTAAS